MLKVHDPHQKNIPHVQHESPIAGPSLADKYLQTRAATEQLCRPLAAEDMVIQSMPDASPVKWHLAHTSWFFETFLLLPRGFSPFNPRYSYLFNSYYEGLGPHYCRARRGLLSRPTVDEVRQYRRYVDERMLSLLREPGAERRVGNLVLLGINHEQQHQELILTDVKHLFATNPLRPRYSSGISQTEAATPMRWESFSAGLRVIGHQPAGEFAFDNESPAHQAWVGSFDLASRPVTNAEYLEFIAEGGYERPEFWLSDGWAAVRENNWKAPLYWEKEDGRWRTMTLTGFRDVNEHEPVCHVSFFEADAYARWVGVRLPTEFEWELAAEGPSLEGNFLESGHYHPVPANGNGESARLQQVYGDVWEWTSSSYAPYPGFRPVSGPLGEYNGKFMCNQMVLRGGSCATPLSHIRRTYRNFSSPQARWQFSGIRLARDR